MATLKQTELLPCPFCGAPAEADSQRGYRSLVSGKIGSAVAIYCTKCSADMSICREDVPDVQLEDAVNKWNTRPADTSQTMLEEAKSLLKRLNRTFDLRSLGNEVENFLTRAKSLPSSVPCVRDGLNVTVEIPPESAAPKITFHNLPEDKENWDGDARNALIENFAIRAALGNNGGEWAAHYNEDQKNHWRKFIRDLVASLPSSERKGEA